MTEYVMAAEAAIRKYRSDAKAWCNESGYSSLACYGVVLEAMTERALNERGFTMHKGKATYPREK